MMDFVGSNSELEPKSDNWLLGKSMQSNHFPCYGKKKAWWRILLDGALITRYSTSTNTTFKNYNIY